MQVTVHTGTGAGSGLRKLNSAEAPGNWSPFWLRDTGFLSWAGGEEAGGRFLSFRPRSGRGWIWREVAAAN